MEQGLRAGQAGEALLGKEFVLKEKIKVGRRIYQLL